MCTLLTFVVRSLFCLAGGGVVAILWSFWRGLLQVKHGIILESPDQKTQAFVFQFALSR
jgi:hypothetical protein